MERTTSGSLRRSASNTISWEVFTDGGESPGVPSHQEIGDMQRSVTSEIPDYKLVDNPLLGANSAQADSRAVPEGCN